MDKEQKDNTANNPDNTTKPTTATTEYIDEPTTDIPDPNTSTSNTTNKNKEPVNIIVNIPPQDSKPQIAANKIQFAGIIVSIGLGILTYILLLKTIEANKTSKDSLIVAQQALSDSRKKDSASEIKEIIIDSLDSIVRERDYIRDTTNIALSKKSLDIQISSMQETQNRFNSESRPLIQIANIKVDSIGDGKKPFIKYDIINMGKFPAKVLTGKIKMIIEGIVSIDEIEKMRPMTKSIFNASVSNVTTIPVRLSASVPIDEEMVHSYKEGKLFIYISGSYDYINIVTKQHYEYSFIYRIEAFPIFNIVGLKSEDKTL